jgi:dihydropyrimidinase
MSQANLHHGADDTPYEGLQITGWPVATMPRGRCVVRGGKPVGGNGMGGAADDVLPWLTIDSRFHF